MRAHTVAIGAWEVAIPRDGATLGCHPIMQALGWPVTSWLSTSHEASNSQNKTQKQIARMLYTLHFARYTTDIHYLILFFCHRQARVRMFACFCVHVSLLMILRSRSLLSLNFSVTRPFYFLHPRSLCDRTPATPALCTWSGRCSHTASRDLFTLVTVQKEIKHGCLAFRFKPATEI